MPQYRPCVPYFHYAIIKLFYNFEARFRKRYHATTNNPHFTFLAKLMQRWSNVVITQRRKEVGNLTLRLQGYSMLPSQNPCYTAGWIYYPTLRQYWYNAIILIQCNIDTMRQYWYVVSTVCGRCEFDIAISILQQRCQDYIHSTMWVKLTTWRWDNVGATCRFDIVASTKPQQCALATQRCDVTATLSQRCVFAEILKSVTKYLRTTLVFTWNRARWEKFDFYFSRAFC